MRFSLLLVLISLFCFSSLTAQRVAEVSFKVPYHIPPAEQLPEEVATYTVKVNDPYNQLLENGLTTSGVAGKIKLRNFKRLPADGHILLSYTVGEFQTTRNEFKSETTESKSKDGKVTKRTTYWREIDYIMPVNLEARDAEGNVLFEQITGAGGKTYTFKNGRSNFTSSKALSTAYNKQRASIFKKMKTDGINGGITGLSNNFRAQYDIRIGNESLYLEHPNGKKAEDQVAWEASAKGAIEILKNVKPDEPFTGEVRTALKPHTDLWEAKMKQYDPTEKKQAKYFHCAQYNLAVVNFILEDFATAEAHAAELATTVKWNKDRPRALNKKIDNAKKLIEASPYDSRYFPLRDLESVTGPASTNYGISASTIGGAGMGSTETVNGYIMLNGEVTQGQITKPSGNMIDFTRQRLIFQAPSGYTTDITPSTVDGFSYNDEIFMVVSLSLKGLNSKKNYLRVIETGDKMTLAEYVHTHANVDDETWDGVQWILTEEDGPISLAVQNVRWLNWKKAFAKLFVDCPVLNAEIGAGNYRRRAEDIARAVRAYNAGDCE